MKPLVLGLLSLLLAPLASASEEYRVFTLADGRVLVAEVLATEASGLRVRVPQGETWIPFTELMDMVPVDREKYEAQEPWGLFLASDAAYRPGFLAIYEGLPSLVIAGEEEGEPLLTPEQTAAAVACDVDLECIVDALAATPRWMWVVVARMEGGEATFEGAVSTGATRTSASAPRVDIEAVNDAAWDALGLEPAPEEPAAAVVAPEPVVPVAPPPRIREPMDRDRVLALSFAPLPGLPSLVQGDEAGFGLAVATVVPATVLWVGATGKNSQSPLQHALLGAGGYYAATVVANQVFGLRSLRRADAAVGLVPTAEGGAALQLTLVR